MLRQLLLFCFIFSATGAWAQAPVLKDTTAKNTSTEVLPKKHSPKTATYLSLALPGAGQVYNRKNWWWKVPIIYGAGGALVYGAVFYNKNFVAFRDAYAATLANDRKPIGNPRFDRFQPETQAAIRDSYREARDQCLIGIVAVYALQVVDAAVEAHFFEFNVSDDLSLNVQPVFVPVGTYASAGIRLNLKLK